MSSLLSVVSDIHSNSTVAVCPPSITLPEGGSYRANAWQKWLWVNWCDYWQQVSKRRGKYINKRPLFVVVNGELTDGDHHKSTQLIAPRNPTVRKRIAVDTLAPMLELKPDEIYVLAGTEAHSGKGWWEDDGIAEDIGAVPVNVSVKSSASSTYIHQFLKLQVDKVLFDIAHHGSTGNLPWTGLNAVVRSAVIMEINYHRLGEPLPQVALRSHKHAHYDTGDNTPIRLLTTCGWQFPTAFVNRIAPGTFPDTGGLLFECNDGEYELWKIHYKPPTRQMTVAGSLKKT